MSTPNFTPGPWEIAFFNASPKTESPYYKVDSQRDGIAHVYNSEANASLIASAPALYEALEALVKTCEYSGSAAHDWETVRLCAQSAMCGARAALSLARGEKGAQA